jgi:hypothetical protein
MPPGLLPAPNGMMPQENSNWPMDAMAVMFWRAKTMGKTSTSLYVSLAREDIVNLKGVDFCRRHLLRGYRERREGGCPE